MRPTSLEPLRGGDGVGLVAMGEARPSADEDGGGRSQSEAGKDEGNWLSK